MPPSAVVFVPVLDREGFRVISTTEDTEEIEVALATQAPLSPRLRSRRAI